MTNALLPLRRLAAALLPALALGCAEGGQTGEETTLTCEETRATLEDGEDSPLGFGADEVLATASADRAALEWLETNPAYGPERGTSELTLSLDALGTAAFVTSRTRDGREAVPCADRVEVEVAVTLATSGGALAEQFDGALLATEPTTATLSRVFEDGVVDGTLSFDEASLAERRITRITFESTFSDGAVSGTLSAGVEQVLGDTVGFQDLTIACFGAATDRCLQR